MTMIIYPPRHYIPAIYMHHYCSCQLWSYLRKQHELFEPPQKLFVKSVGECKAIARRVMPEELQDMRRVMPEELQDMRRVMPEELQDMEINCQHRMYVNIQGGNKLVRIQL